MNNEKLDEIETEDEESEEIHKIPETASNVRGPKAKPVVLIVIGGLAVLVLAVLLIWFYISRDSGGKPVLAPRDVSGSNQNPALSGEQTISLTDEQLRAAGLLIETVGEDLAPAAVSTATTGVIEPNDYKETPVMSLVSGVARQVPVELGQFVRAGETVAVIYSEELARTEADYLAKRADVEEADRRYQRAGRLTGIASESRDELDEMRAKLRIAEAEHVEHLSHFRRSEKLLAIGAVSREEFEAVKTKYDSALARLEESKSRFARAEQLLKINPVRNNEEDRALAELRTARSGVASLRQKLLVLGLSQQRVGSLTSTNQISSALPIPAPVSGTVTGRKINPGEIVPANMELVRITNLANVWAIGQVFEKDLAALRIGSGASVTTQAYPGEIFRGNVSYIDPNLDQTTRTAKVRIELPNTPEKLKIGMYVNIAFATLGGSENTVPTVPENAVQNISNQQIVFLATSDPKVFVLKQVKTGPLANGRFPILEGLFVGDKIVTEGSFLLRAEWLKFNRAGL